MHGEKVTSKCGNEVRNFSVVITLVSAQSIAFLCCASAALAQYPTPQQQKDAFEGMSKEQIRDKIMALGFPTTHFSDKWPVNFPLPKYTNAVDTKWMNSTKGSPTAFASLNTKDSPATVYKFYLDACNQSGWKTRAPSAKALAGTPATFLMFEGYKDKEMIRVHCLPNKKLHGTTASISWFKVSHMPRR
jgi:hypothetical protein